MTGRSTIGAGGRKAAETVRGIKAALERSEYAALPKVIRIVKELSGSLETISIDDMADIIGQDMTTVTRILEIAKTMGYNPEGVEISSIRQAIHIIGFNRIRNLAISLLVSQSASRRTAAPETQEVAALSLGTGFLAQSIMRGVNPSAVDEAFICGALKDYGKLMLTMFRIDDFRRVGSMSAGMPSDDAYRDVFGLTPIELSRELLTTAQMPTMILKSVRAFDPASADPEIVKEGQDLLHISELSRRVCSIVGRGDLTHDRYLEVVQNALSDFAKFVPLDREALEARLVETEGRVASLKNYLGDAGGKSPLMANLKRLEQGMEIVPSVVPEIERVVRSAQKLERFFEEAIADLNSGELIGSAGEMYRHGAQVLVDAFGLESCIVVKSAAGVGVLEIVAAIPADGGSETSVGQRVGVEERSVFAICSARHEDVVVRDPNDAQLRPFIPDWVRDHAPDSPFVLFPLVRGESTEAIFCGFHRVGKSIALSTKALQLTRDFRRALLELCV